MKARRFGRFRVPVARLRKALPLRERQLFDVVCRAGTLGYGLRNDAVNVKEASGRRDPRIRMMPHLSRIRSSAGTAVAPAVWERAGGRLARMMTDALATELRLRRRALYVLMAHAAIGLAPDCVVPRDPVLRAAWKAIVRTFGSLFPATVKRLPRLAWLDQRSLAVLSSEVAAGIRRGRRATGGRPGPAGRSLAVDSRLLALAGAALGKDVSPDYVALYLIYTKPGDHFWPHPDDEKFAPINLFVCIDRELPKGRARGSAFLAFRPDGSVRRYELAPGRALVFDGRGLVHGREPLRRGERVVLLSIWLRLREDAD